MATKEENENGLWLTKDDVTKITDDLESFANFQRLSSMMIWIGIGMVALHIMADIFFHTRS